MMKIMCSLKLELIKTNTRNLRVQVVKDKMGIVYCRIDGAARIEKRPFLDAMQEVLVPTDNPHYLLIRQSYLGKKFGVDYHPVPKIIG
ncbi:MAG: hypothetical protein GY804_06000 [Alphaproteobacteria bacterium]|nr:hypothetical protein [Alphaproteobacteria bacterium]